MGTIIGRTRKDGTATYVAQILLKRKGLIAHRESQTFDRKQAAKAWIARRETELAEGNVDRSKDVVLDRSYGGSRWSEMVRASSRARSVRRRAEHPTGQI